MIGITVILAMCVGPYFPSPPNCSASSHRILFSSDSNLPIFAGFNSEMTVDFCWIATRFDQIKKCILNDGCWRRDVMVTSCH